MIRLTSAGSAPAAGDQMHILGEWTAGSPDVLTTRTVTIDSTANTSYGPTVSGGPPQGLTVGNGGTLQFGTTATTNYYFRIKGILGVYYGGTLNAGTGLPATSTIILEFASVANVDSGLVIYNGGSFTSLGKTLTYDRCYLDADCIIGATSLTTSVSTGWVNNDNIAIASTTQTYSQTEAKVATGSAGTALSIAALTYAHSGTAPTKAEMINLTRSVVIRGITSTLCGYILLGNSTTVSCQWTEFYWLGSATSMKRGINVETTTGSCLFSRCSIHDGFVVASGANGIFTGQTSTAVANVTIQYNVFYSLYVGIQIGVTSLGSIVVDNNWVLLTNNAGIGIYLSDIGSTITNNVVAGSIGVGIALVESNGIFNGTFSGNTVHSCGTYGILCNATGIAYGISSFLNLTVWRCSQGVWFLGGYASGVGTPINAITINGLTIFGNINAGLTLGDVRNSLVTNVTSNADGAFGQAYGSNVAMSCPGTVVENSSFGTSVANTSGDIYSQNGGLLIFNNCLFSSSTLLANQTAMNGGFIGIQNFNQLAGNHRTYYSTGTIATDTTIYRTGSPSERLTPLSNAQNLESGKRRTSIAQGQTVTFSCWVRKSVVGDGTAYNGGQPQLVVKANASAGINADTVLATQVGIAGVWEQLSGNVTPTNDAVIETCLWVSGTQGFVNDCDWGVS